MSQSDPNTPEAPQEATEGRQSAFEGPSGQRETPKGQNVAHAGAESLDGEPKPRGPVDWARHYAHQREQQTSAPLRDRIAEALADATGNQWPAQAFWTEADAVLAVRDREMERMKILVAASESDAHAVRLPAQYADKAIENGERAERAEAAIERVRQLCSPEQNTEQLGYLRRSRDVLAALDEPAHNAGPSVAECAQADRNWDVQKAGE